MNFPGICHSMLWVYLIYVKSTWRKFLPMFVVNSAYCL